MLNAINNFSHAYKQTIPAFKGKNKEDDELILENNSVIENEPKDKTKVYPGLCSFLIPGTGQYINGDNKKGNHHFAACIVLNLVSRIIAYPMRKNPQLTSEGLPKVTPLMVVGSLLGIGNLIFHIFSAVDAHDNNKQTK